jgi:hypothetical protein
MDTTLVKESLELLEKGLNIAVAKGAYSVATDVAALSQSLNILKTFVQQQSMTFEAQKEPKKEEDFSNNKEEK